MRSGLSRETMRSGCLSVYQSARNDNLQIATACLGRDTKFLWNQTFESLDDFLVLDNHHSWFVPSLLFGLLGVYCLVFWLSLSYYRSYFTQQLRLLLLSHSNQTWQLHTHSMNVMRCRRCRHAGAGVHDNSYLT